MPRETLQSLIADSQPVVFLTQSHLAAYFDGPQKVPTLLLDARSYATLNGRPEIQETKHSVDDLAYVIYTLDASGMPLGVMITRSNLAHMLPSLQSAIGLIDADVYLHTAPISVSSFIRQLLLPLSVGATVIIATNEQIENPLALFVAIKHFAVTVIDLAPSYWRSCIQVLGSSGATRAQLMQNNLRLILSSSGPLLSDVPWAWRFVFDHPAEILNMFGETETAGIVARRTRLCLPSKIFVCVWYHWDVLLTR